MKKTILILFVFLTGCFNTQPPKWYIKEYGDTKNYIFATGEGKTKKSALNDALSYAASKLKVTINSTYESNKGYINSPENSYENVKQTIISRVENFSFYDYQIDKSKKIDGKYYVLIKIDREKNAKKILKNAQNRLKEIELHSKTNDKIEIVKKYPKLINENKKIISDIYISKSLYPSSWADELLQKAVNLKNILERRLNSVTFYVTNDYENTLHDSLSALNQKISNNGIKINQNAKIRKNKAAGLYIYKINSTVTLKDKTSHTFEVKCAGKSVSGYEIAKEFAIKQCKEKIKKKLSSILQTRP